MKTRFNTAGLFTKSNRGRVTVTSYPIETRVEAPYSDDFRKAAKKLGGQWSEACEAWHFPAPFTAQLLPVIESCYDDSHDLYFVDNMGNRLSPSLDN